MNSFSHFRRRVRGELVQGFQESLQFGQLTSTITVGDCVAENPGLSGRRVITGEAGESVRRWAINGTGPVHQ